MTEYPIVMVTWIDSTSVHEWEPISEHKGYAPHEIHSVGYLVSEDASQIIIVQNIDYASEDGSMVMHIPVVAITSLDYLYDPDEEGPRIRQAPSRQ